MIRKFKLFLSPIRLTAWLNKMSREGYRLVKVGKIFYYLKNAKGVNML